jgi:hypothetical protein
MRVRLNYLSSDLFASDALAAFCLRWATGWPGKIRDANPGDKFSISS